MKKTFVILLCLIALAVMAANPSFQSFFTTQFTAPGSGSAQTIGIKSGAYITNMQSFQILNIYGAIQSVDGSARGSNSIDLQLTRINSGAVAAANYSSILGGHDNIIGPGVDNSVIVGGYNNAIYSNIITDTQFSFGGLYGRNVIGGGNHNIIDGNYSVIGGGYSLQITGTYDFIGSGRNNQILGNGNFDTIGGGLDNYIQAGSSFGTVGGGDNNAIDGGDYVSILGGLDNYVDRSPMSAIGGGRHNWIITGTNSFIYGGNSNQITVNNSGVIGHNVTNATANSVEIGVGGTNKFRFSDTNFTLVGLGDGIVFADGTRQITSATNSVSSFSNYLVGNFIGTNQFVTNNQSILAIISNTPVYFSTPQQFGAVGDGTTDDTVPLQTWLNYCSTNINYPLAILTAATGGWYKITGTLYASNALTIMGLGGQLFASSAAGNGLISHSRIMMTTANTTALKIANASDSVKIERVFISCNVANNYTNGGCAGIEFSGNGGNSDLVYLSQCLVTNFGKGIDLNGASDCVVQLCSPGYNGNGITLSNIGNSVALFNNQLSYNYGTQLVSSTTARMSISGDIAWGQDSSGLGSNGVGCVFNAGSYVKMDNVNMENNSTNPSIIVNGGRLTIEHSAIGNFITASPNSWSIFNTNGGRVFIGADVALNGVSSTNAFAIRTYNDAETFNYGVIPVTDLYTINGENWTNSLSPFRIDFPSLTGGSSTTNRGPAAVGAGMTVTKRLTGTRTEGLLWPTELANYGISGRVYIDLLGYQKDILSTVTVSNLVVTGTNNISAGSITNFTNTVQTIVVATITGTNGVTVTNTTATNVLVSANLLAGSNITLTTNAGVISIAASGAFGGVAGGFATTNLINKSAWTNINSTNFSVSVAEMNQNVTIYMSNFPGQMITVNHGGYPYLVTLSVPSGNHINGAQDATLVLTNLNDAVTLVCHNNVGEGDVGWWVVADNRLSVTTTNSISALSASSVTNYTATLSAAASDYQKINTANTNANISFASIALGRSVTLVVDASTSSVPCVVKFPANVITNSSLILTVTNATRRIYNLIPMDGTDSTNVYVTGGDYYIR